MSVKVRIAREALGKESRMARFSSKVAECVSGELNGLEKRLTAVTKTVQYQEAGVVKGQCSVGCPRRVLGVALTDDHTAGLDAA